jgi:hypothetical protein
MDGTVAVLSRSGKLGRWKSVDYPEYSCPEKKPEKTSRNEVTIVDILYGSQPYPNL